MFSDGLPDVYQPHFLTSKAACFSDFIRFSKLFPLCKGRNTGVAGLSGSRNTIGVLTNSPDYLWHQTNLRNYVGVINLPKAPQGLPDMRSGNLARGLREAPACRGDYSSPFLVRPACVYEAVCRPGEDEQDGVSRMFRAFAPVDIPEGLAKAGPECEAYEQTLCTSVMCAESGVYYFAPAWNRRISAVQLPERRDEIQYFDLGNGQDIDWRN